MLPCYCWSCEEIVTQRKVVRSPQSLPVLAISVKYGARVEAKRMVAHPSIHDQTHIANVVYANDIGRYTRTCANDIGRYTRIKFNC